MELCRAIQGSFANCNISVDLDLFNEGIIEYIWPFHEEIGVLVILLQWWDTGGEVVVEGYGPGDPPGGVALAELSRRELKDSARWPEEGPPWGRGGRRGEPRVGTDSARERRRSSKTLTLLLRLRWTGQVCLATLIPEREIAVSRAFTPSATTRVRLYLLHSLTRRSQ